MPELELLVMPSSFTQIASSATPRALLGPGDNRMSRNARIKASTNTVFIGGNSQVSSTTGVQVPSGDAAPYMEIDMENPGEIYVVGVGQVYIIFEDVP